ncbi:MAG: flavodoxin [Treponema sp.]
MKKAVVYSTTTGNTEAMANAVAEGVKKSGAELIMTTADSADADAVLAADVLILGSPAMGDEVLEDTMEEFFTSIEGKISGKKVAIFGSYDWGDGQWLRDWAVRIKDAGAVLVNGDGLAGQLEPDEDCKAECVKLGETA